MPPDLDDEQRLARAAQDGDLDAFSELVERHHRVVLAFLGSVEQQRDAA